MCKESYTIQEENAENFHGRNGRVEGSHEADTKGAVLSGTFGNGGRDHYTARSRATPVGEEWR